MSVRQGNTIIAGGNSVTVDQALDINSPNAIANSAVTAGLNGKEPTITGAATTITTNNLAAARAVITDANGKVAASTVTSTELGYMHGVTSAVQTQLNGKEATITGAATTITGSNLTASRVVVSDANGKIDVSSTTSTELGYVHGVTSDIQTQINAKAADNAVVHLADAETISGVKTFSASPKVPTAGITSDDTTAASTAFVRDIMPAGVIVPFAGTTVPAGYLLCDGSAVSRTTYADLFAAIGTTYGAGDGNTTFNLPNMFLRSPLFTGLGQMGATSDGSVPNLHGQFYSGTHGGVQGDSSAADGTLFQIYTAGSGHTFTVSSGSNYTWTAFDFNASRCSGCYGRYYTDDKIIPSFIHIPWCIKY